MLRNLRQPVATSLKLCDIGCSDEEADRLLALDAEAGAACASQVAGFLVPGGKR
ncbi:MAG: hypothetical protein ACREHD_22630 [Pirellulales bacterium]